MTNQQLAKQIVARLLALRAMQPDQLLAMQAARAAQAQQAAQQGRQQQPQQQSQQQQSQQSNGGNDQDSPRATSGPTSTQAQAPQCKVDPSALHAARAVDGQGRLRGIVLAGFSQPCVGKEGTLTVTRKGDQPDENTSGQIGRDGTLRLAFDDPIAPNSIQGTKLTTQ